MTKEVRAFVRRGTITLELVTKCVILTGTGLRKGFVGIRAPVPVPVSDSPYPLPSLS